MKPQVHAEIGLKSKDKLFLLVGDRNFVVSQLIRYSQKGDLERCTTDFAFTDEEAKQITSIKQSRSKPTAPPNYFPDNPESD